jgi:chromosomal replication initiation ATPase DnaA
VETEVVGRDAELETIGQWLDAPLPSALLIGGGAGIGKTTLWHAGVEEARERGYRALACAAPDSEMQFSFIALRDLLVDAFDEVADQLPGPQRAPSRSPQAVACSS